MNVHDFLSYRMEKTAGAKRLQRLLAKGNKMTARGEEVPDDLMAAAGTAMSKLKRRAERNPEYDAELQRRMSRIYGSRTNQDRVMSEIATGFNKKRSSTGGFSLRTRNDGKMVLPKKRFKSPHYF